jgi:diaminohydroxyphosphoribosylaminopyrimidine deaminase/5-amino-6-(5-phosphoribosylamino)uracil reductase
MSGTPDATSPFAFLLEGAPAAAPSLVTDHELLRLALREARKGVGRTAPNPPVGAVVAKDGAIVGVGFHAKAGTRHAEIVALDAVAAVDPGLAAGSTVAVTLEPCVHHGRTPPCIDRLLADKVGRVVVGAIDPNPRVQGRGVATLRAAGVEIVVADGPLAAEAAALIEPFRCALVEKRPYVVLKIATSLDGRVAVAHGGLGRGHGYITGPEARGLVHRLRDHVDAVVVGAGTVKADDPALTVRDLAPGDGRIPRDPLRVVLDARLDTDPRARVYGDRGLVVHGGADPERRSAFDDAGVPRLEAATMDGRVDLVAAFAALPARGVMAVLVEAGPRLATALLTRGLVDELWWLDAPLLLGGDATPAVGGLGLRSPADAPRFAPIHHARLGEDRLVVLRPAR